MGKAELDAPLSAPPFRWIETQAPQFPAQHASRNYAAWEGMRLRMNSGK
jgi:hypothetical protein